LFRKSRKLKYLGVDINSRNNYHEEIDLRVNAGNRCYSRYRKPSGVRYYQKNQTGEYEIRSNKEIKELRGEEDIIQTHKGRKMSWHGRVWRTNGIMKDTLNWKPKDKRPLGRPKKRWIDESN